VGAPGTVAGVTAAEAAEAGPVPTALIAETVKVYAVPFVKPVRVWVVAVELKFVAICAVLPTYGVTV
jgi:hypothetical protein